MAATMPSQVKTSRPQWEDFVQIAKFFREAKSEDITDKYLSAVFEKARDEFEQIEFDF